MLLCGICNAAGELPKAVPSTENEVAAVIERAKVDPSILRELKDAPIDKIFQPLHDLWSEGMYLRELRLNVNENNQKERLALQKKIGADPDTAERLARVAFEVLLSKPDLEAYITGRLQIINTYFTDARAWKYPGPMFDASGEAGSLLRVAIRVPGAAAFRMVGPYLSVPDEPDLPRGVIARSAPARTAQVMMEYLVKERFGIDLGRDVKATRKWWAENKHRFEVEPKQN